MLLAYTARAVLLCVALMNQRGNAALLETFLHFSGSSMHVCEKGTNNARGDRQLYSRFGKLAFPALLPDWAVLCHL